MTTVVPSARLTAPLFAVAVLLAALQPSMAEEAVPRDARESRQPLATIEGTVVYRNDTKRAWRYARYYVRSAKSGELADAVVALDGPGLKGWPRPERSSIASVDQKDMRFVPETAAIRAGDHIRFTNSDPQTHNVSLSDPRRQFSDTIANGREAAELFPRASGIRRPFALGCLIHSQMQAWIYVFNHPFFAVTGADGRFRLEHVPAGAYRLDAAHSAGSLHASRLLEVKGGQTLKIDIVFDPQSRSDE